ncbi:MAG: hypothetical protein HC872_07870 [Gammaproteobacteria bacterium]|nr:hypothetical protein [Gammaproteobacteria bacterium]
MDESRAQSIVAALANGVDPITGKTFAADSPYQAPDIVRALYLAAQALEARAQTRARPKGELPANAGKPWSDEEDRRLLTQFDSGQSVQELARDPCAHRRGYSGAAGAAWPLASPGTSGSAFRATDGT